MTMPKGPFCQSCSMPMVKPEDFGTAADGFRINDYCYHCFDRGAFTAPNVTLPGMIDKCAQIMAQQGFMPEPQAHALMEEMIPRLKRWRTAASAA
jgi:hypothetical protein